VNDLVTGRLAGAGAGDHDIDGGVTSIRPPAIALPASGALSLSASGFLNLTFSYYLAHGTNSSTADFLRVSVVGATTAVVFQELGGRQQRRRGVGFDERRPERLRRADRPHPVRGGRRQHGEPGGGRRGRREGDAAMTRS
jgi:hypothetical protein